MCVRLALLFLVLMLLAFPGSLSAELLTFAQEPGATQVVVVNVQKSYVADYILVGILMAGALYAVCKSGTQS